MKDHVDAIHRLAHEIPVGDVPGNHLDIATRRRLVEPPCGPSRVVRHQRARGRAKRHQALRQVTADEAAGTRHEHATMIPGHRVPTSREAPPRATEHVWLWLRLARHSVLLSALRADETSRTA